MTDKVRENRCRRAADRQGLRLEKSRARDPRDITYGTYQLVYSRADAPDVTICAHTQFAARRGYGLNLDEIEGFLLAEKDFGEVPAEWIVEEAPSRRLRVVR